MTKEKIRMIKRWKYKGTKALTRGGCGQPVRDVYEDEDGYVWVFDTNFGWIIFGQANDDLENPEDINIIATIDDDIPFPFCF